ncbi:MAG: TetR/AcrR family transcriptional regulator [Chloroflexota bacterium]
MGRKDLTAERQSLILDAMERCIVKYGLQRATLENIANEAGINRGLIHHYVGNRDDVVQLMADRLLERYQESFAKYAAARPEGKRADAVVDYYFDAWFDLAPEDDAVIHNLLAESERDPRIKKVLRKLYDGFEEMIAGELLRLFPKADAEKLHSVAYSLMALAMAHASLAWLGLKQARQTDVRSTAANLVQMLES